MTIIFWCVLYIVHCSQVLLFLEQILNNIRLSSLITSRKEQREYAILYFSAFFCIRSGFSLTWARKINNKKTILFRVINSKFSYTVWASEFCGLGWSYILYQFFKFSKTGSLLTSRYILISPIAKNIQIGTWAPTFLFSRGQKNKYFFWKFANILLWLQRTIAKKKICNLNF